MRRAGHRQLSKMVKISGIVFNLPLTGALKEIVARKG